MRMSCGMPPCFKGSSPISFREATSILASDPENSQVNTAVPPSAEKSAWLRPMHSGIVSAP